MSGPYWCNVSRTSGEPTEAGEFLCSDESGYEWAVLAFDAQSHLGELWFNEPVCLTGDMIAGLERRDRMFDAVKKVLEAEVAAKRELNASCNGPQSE